MTYTLKIKEADDKDFQVPGWYKKIVLNRVKTADKENFKFWNDIKKQIRHK